MRAASALSTLATLSATANDLTCAIVCKAEAAVTEAPEIAVAPQRTIQARRGDLEPAVVRVLHFQHILQLSRDSFAILDQHELGFTRGVRLAGHAVDRDAQEPAADALDVDQVVSQPGDGAFDGRSPAWGVCGYCQESGLRFES